jgi:hypothetical protein
LSSAPANHARAVREQDRSSGGDIPGSRRCADHGQAISILLDVVPATRLRQGFAGVMTVGRRSFGEDDKRGPITTSFDCLKQLRRQLSRY